MVKIVTIIHLARWQRSWPAEIITPKEKSARCTIMSKRARQLRSFIRARARTGSVANCSLAAAWAASREARNFHDVDMKF